MPEKPPSAAPEPGAAGGRSAAGKVAAGIAASRVLGLVREVLVARLLGVGAYADVFRTALRGPNLLQNLLGEQTLSAAFIPVYSRLIEEGRRREAGELAGAVFGLLLAAVGGLVLLGELLAEPLVALLASGYLADAAKVAAGEATVDRFPLAVTAVRWIFPMTGFLVLSAWALAILNSHRRFLLAYTAPVAWNAAILAALVFAGGEVLGGGVPEPGDDLRRRIVLAACAGALIGGLLQFLVQLPAAWRLAGRPRPSFDWRSKSVRRVVGAFGPLFAGRGAVQVSSYLDTWLASFLRAGAQSALGFAQGLYLLPISLFGMSVAAAELPELSRDVEDAEERAAERIRRAVAQASFLAVPAAVGYLAVGREIVDGLFRGASFELDDAWLVYLTLAVYAVGMPASIVTRQLNTLFYAAGETRMPARVAVERIVISAAVGSAGMLWLDRFGVSETLGIPQGDVPLYLGGVGLAAGAALASGYEAWRMRRATRRRWPAVRLPWRRLRRIGALAVTVGLTVRLAAVFLPALPAALEMAVLVGAFAAVYLGGAALLRWPELAAWRGTFGRSRR